MKMVCICKITNEICKASILKITFGKTYDIYEDKYLTNASYYINDAGEELGFYYNDTDFITLQEWRDKKLKELGI